MDSSLCFTVTLVALAWLSVSTFAQDTTTASPNTTLAITATAASNTTTVATVTTAPPPLVFNNTVTPLEANVTSEGCGTERLCAGEPSGCNPATGTCTLLGAKKKNVNIYEFVLAGVSSGYLGATVGFGQPEETAYICYNKNGNVAFAGAALLNGVLTLKNVSANNVRGKQNGKKIQCIFDATVDSSTATSAKASGVALGVIDGTYSDTTNSFGPANSIIKTAPLDISNPIQTVVNTVAGATTAGPTVAATNRTTTSGSAALFQRVLIHALMISVGMMGLTML